ncbi:MAG: diacylglycerol kinase family protein [Coriobacteriaceae bacterium]|nr:diacylglycerol kinase family protein [Coriobacteriaceae bacterium]
MKPRYTVVSSFKYAIDGIIATFREGHNIRIQAAGGVLAIALGLIFQISELEWLAIFICCGLVLGGECFNTAIEHTVDLAMPDRHPDAKAAKDQAAGAVLLFALGSLAVGIVIFLPKILALFH